MQLNPAEISELIKSRIEGLGVSADRVPRAVRRPASRKGCRASRSLRALESLRSIS